MSPNPDLRPADASPAGEPGGFRPVSRRRARLAAGAALAAVAIGGNVLVYSSLDDRVEVLQVVTDVRAGEIVHADDLRVVEVAVDPTVPVVAATDIGLVAERHARVHIASGSLVSPVLVQAEPLVSPGAAVVAVELRPTLVPTGLRERSAVELVVLDDETTHRVVGRVVTRPTGVDGVTGLVSMSVEVAAADAPDVAAGRDIRVVLRDPGPDPVYGEEAG